MNIFETHSHYDDEAYEDDREELLSSMPSHGISPVINVGATMESSRKGLELANKYSFVYSAIGVHPSDIDCLNEDEMKWLHDYSSHKKVVSIGEIGLDYYWEKDENKRDEQKYWFKRQLQLAKEVNLPVIIHSREACSDTLTIMNQAMEDGIQGVMHCFSYSPEIAHEYVKKGFYIGVGGVVTFKNGKKLKETVKEIPLTNILVETDCPYLSPEPFRGSRNDSTYLPYIVKEIAKIKEITEAEVIETTAQNAQKLFYKTV